MEATLTSLDRQLLDAFQRDFPLSPRPYAEMAQRLGVSEEVVLARLRMLQEQGVISRIGAVVAPGRAGASTLAAIAVPPARLEPVADIVSAFPEVNHNYAREDVLNLWFVVTAASREALVDTLGRIGHATGLTVHAMPMLDNFHVDLGFSLADHQGSSDAPLSHRISA